MPIVQENRTAAVSVAWKGEDMTRRKKQGSIISDCNRGALLGAPIYHGWWFANARSLLLNLLLNDIEHKQLFYDSKTTSCRKSCRKSGTQPVEPILTKKKARIITKTLLHGGKSKRK